MCSVENPVELQSAEAVADPQLELRRIFDLCDHEGQGYIEKKAFHDLGKSIFGGSEEVSCQIDTQQTFQFFSIKDLLSSLFSICGSASFTPG